MFKPIKFQTIKILSDLIYMSGHIAKNNVSCSLTVAGTNHENVCCIHQENMSVK